MAQPQGAATQKRPPDGPTGEGTERQTDIQTNRHADRQTDRRIDG